MRKRCYYECSCGYLGSLHLEGGDWYSIEIGTDHPNQNPHEILESYAFTVGRFSEHSRIEIVDEHTLQIFRALVQQKKIKLDMVLRDHAWLKPIG